MKTQHKKICLFISFMLACLFGIAGIFCVYSPLTTIAQVATASVRLGGELSSTTETVKIELYSETLFVVGDRLLYNDEFAKITELPSEADGTEYYTLSSETGGQFYQKKGQTITVTVNPTSEALAFNPEATASLDSTDLNRLRFALYVSEASVSVNKTLSVRFASGTGEDCKLGFGSDNIIATQATQDLSNYNFSGGMVTVYIYVTGPLRTEMQLVATVGENTATSETRSIFYVWGKAVENDFGGMVVADSVRNYITLSVSFSSDNETLAISTAAQLSSSNGLSLMVKVTDSYLEILKKGKTIKSEINLYPGVRYTYEDYFLYIKRTSDLNDYGNASANLGSGDLYHVNPSECVEPYTNEPKQLSKEFLNSGIGIFSIDLPTNAEQEYYYYPIILKFTRTETVYSHNVEFDSLNREYTAFSTNYYHASLKNLALEVLGRDASMSDEERAWLQDTAGVKPDTNQITVTMTYKILSDYVSLTEKTYLFSVKSVWAQNKRLVMSALYDLTEFNNIAKLNVVYTGDFWRDGYKYTTQERIVLQARDFNYTYNSSTQTGALEVVYGDFQYKDLSFRITNNDPANNLTIDYYTADVVVTDTTTTMKFNFENIEEQLLNSCGWIFDFGKNNVTISGESSGVTTELTDETLIVTFPNNKEKELVNLSLVGVAEIMEDIPYAMTYEYISLSYQNGEIWETLTESASVQMMYSKITTYNFTNFMLDYGDIVRAAVHPEFLVGVEYFIPDSVRKEYSDYDAEAHTCKITVEYSYNTIFKITDNLDGEPTFKSLNHSSLLYTGDYFVSAIPAGYRVELITTPAAFKDKLTITPAEKYSETQVEVRTSTNAKEILSIEITFTDSWNLTLDYLSPYKTTPFAERKSTTCSIKVKDYANIYELTSENVKSILGVSTIAILKSSADQAVKVTFDDKTDSYTAIVTYSFATLRTVDYLGNNSEVKVPLTSYGDWLESVGFDWSIRMLNTKENTYFKYTNEISPDKLYGYFSMAVMKEKQTDLSHYFRQETGEGCQVMHQFSEVKGSDFYKIVSNTKLVFTVAGGTIGGILGGHILSGAAIGTAANYGILSLCESVNNDNGIYYTYFFYLDGFSTQSYLTANGASDAFDIDSAIKNTIDDVWNEIKSLWDSLNDSPFYRILMLCAGLLVIVGAVGIMIKFIKWVFGGEKRR